MTQKLAFAVVALLTLSASAVYAFQYQRKKAPEGAEVYFIAPKDGDTLTSPVTVKFGLRGMGIAPAGVDWANTGHHHILVNANALPDMNSPIPMNETFRHFGGGQTETELHLEPGRHTLQLLLGDVVHVPHDPPIISEKITITVK